VAVIQIEWEVVQTTILVRRLTSGLPRPAIKID
jgi:hypothetical protein